MCSYLFANMSSLNNWRRVRGFSKLRPRPGGDNADIRIQTHLYYALTLGKLEILITLRLRS